MTPTTQAMLLIKSLDDAAALLLSKYTQGWYVRARINVSDGIMLGGVAGHRDTPDDAVAAFLQKLQEIPLSEVIVVNADDNRRREYRWNGAAFAEQAVSIREMRT